MKLNVCVNDSIIVDRSFFGFFNQVIDALDYADRKGEYMMVDFSHGPYAYGKWSDYFSSPEDYQKSDFKLSGINPPTNKKSLFKEAVYSSKKTLTKEEINRAAYLVNKYVKIKRDPEHIAIDGYNTLGIHISKDHPIDTCIEKIKQAMLEKNLGYLYLLTDCHETLAQFQRSFPDQLLHKINFSGISTAGRELLNGALDLSRCAYFMKTDSDLSNAVLFFNPNINYENL